MHRHPKTLATAIIVLIVGSLIAVQSLNQASSDEAQLVSASQQHPKSMVGWNHWTGPTTTTTAPPPPPTTVAHAPQVHHKAPSQPKQQSTGGSEGFAACVRQHESTNNYGYNDGQYHGAYNMTTDHWGGYGGYSRPEDAPPSVQDAKFQDDVSHGSAYLRSQYPVTSRMCGG